MKQSEKLQTINAIIKKLHRINLNPGYRFYFDSHHSGGCYRIMYIDMTPQEFVGTGKYLVHCKEVISAPLDDFYFSLNDGSLDRLLNDAIDR